MPRLSASRSAGKRDQIMQERCSSIRTVNSPRTLKVLREPQKRRYLALSLSLDSSTVSVSVGSFERETGSGEEESVLMIIEILLLDGCNHLTPLFACLPEPSPGARSPVCPVFRARRPP